MKIWKEKLAHYSEIISQLNKLEKEHAIVKQIISEKNSNYYRIFYTIEDNIESED